jgi:hypothetical protein
MKKIALLTGVISSCLFLLGVLFKSLHWPGAGIVLLLSVVLFALVYSPFLMMEKNKLTQNANQKFTNAATMVAMSVIAVSFLFKAMHWPGAGIGMYISHAILVIMIPLLYVHASKESDETKRINFYNEAVLLTVFTAFSFFIWLVTSR